MASLTLSPSRPKVAAAAPAPVLPGYAAVRHQKGWARKKVALLAVLSLLTFLYAFFFLLLPRSFSVVMSFPLLAMALFVIWALPAYDYQPRRWINFCFWAYFLSLILWPNYLAIGISGLPWITVIRLFGAPMVLLLLIYTSTSIPFRSEMSNILGQSSVIVKFLVAFAIVQLLSIAFSASVFQAVYAVVNNQIAWTAMFFAAVWVLRKPSSVETWLRLYIFMAFALCPIAILEARNGGVLWANSIPSFLKIEDETVERILGGAYRLGANYRVVATATTPLSLAELLGATSPLLLFAFTQYRSVLLKLALLGLDLLLVYCILLTDSRLGLVAMIVGHVGYFAYRALLYYRHGGNRYFASMIVITLPIAVSAVFAAMMFVGRVRNAVIGDGRQSYSDQARAEQISGGLIEIWSSPLFGFGAGQGAVKLNFTNAAGTLTIDNYYLSILLDYGFIGFIAFYGMMVAGIVQGFKIAMQGMGRINHLAGAIALFLLCFLVTKAVLSQEANHSLIFMALAAVVTLTAASRNSNRTDATQRVEILR